MSGTLAVTLQAPVLSAVVVYVVPLTATLTDAPASVTPLICGVVTLVMLSVELLPVSLPLLWVIDDGAGGVVVSMVKAVPVTGPLLLPAASVTVVTGV